MNGLALAVPSDVPSMLALAARADEPPACLGPGEQERHDIPEGLLYIARGCVAATLDVESVAPPLPGLHREVVPVEMAFEVPPGASSLRAFFHLHGDEAIEVRLLDASAQPS